MSKRISDHPPGVRDGKRPKITESNDDMFSDSDGDDVILQNLGKMFGSLAACQKLTIQGVTTEGYTKVLTCETVEKSIIELRVSGEWFYCSFTVGMRINVIGLPVDRVIDNDSDALIITHPDVLVSPTTVSSSIRCLRQSVLTEVIYSG
eukprot:sb/3473600/